MMFITISAPTDVHINKCTNRYSITKAGRYSDLHDIFQSLLRLYSVG